MLSRFPGFTNLPAPVKMGVLLAGGGSLAGIMMYFLRSFVRGWGLIIILLAIALVGGLWVGLRKWRKSRQKKESEGFEEDLTEHSKKAPKEVKDPNQIADLDSLRRKFHEGVNTLKEQGKSPRFLPWYMVIGESGAGKTEAIRHADLDLPAGLTDPQQGTGGTINMDWWFTNNAILLDTAGKMIFGDVDAGGSKAWQEFLKLLKKHRRNCPINGLILCIPATSLIEDSTSDIKEKADKLAQQVGRIQTTLGGLRFPIYVIVTKSDLISGFREFTEELGNGPLEQEQILGWSYDEDLDAPFDPDVLDSGMEDLVEEVRSRVMSMLRSPSPRTHEKRRTEEVDALFSFPTSLSEVVPRLRFYLQKVFKTTTGPWAQKSLFMRGVYFTSAMVEGKVLDAQVAEALNVDVEELPGGGPNRRIDPYFLHDTFSKKAFREDGLVTWAKEAKREYRRRKGLVLGLGLTTILVLIALTVYGAVSFYRNIGRHQTLWGAAAVAMQEGWPGIVTKPHKGDVPYGYRGQSPISELDLTRSQFYTTMRERIEKDPIHVPTIFWFIAEFNRDRFSRETRIRALAKLAKEGLLAPLARAADGTMRGDAGEPRIPDVDAVAQLVRLHNHALQLERDAHPSGSENLTPPPVNLGPLVEFVCPETSEYEADEHRKALQDTINWLYSPEQGGQCLPSDALPDDTVTTALQKLVADSVESTIEQGPAYENLQLIKDIAALLRAYDDTEQAVLDVPAADDSRVPSTTAEYEALAARWDEKTTALQQSAQTVLEEVDKLQNRMSELANTDESGLPDSYALCFQDIRSASVKPFYGLPLNIRGTYPCAETEQGETEATEEPEEAQKEETGETGAADNPEEKGDGGRTAPDEGGQQSGSDDKTPVPAGSVIQEQKLRIQALQSCRAQARVAVDDAERTGEVEDLATKVKGAFMNCLRQKPQQAAGGETPRSRVPGGVDVDEAAGGAAAAARKLRGGRRAAARALLGRASRSGETPSSEGEGEQQGEETSASQPGAKAGTQPGYGAELSGLQNRFLARAGDLPENLPALVEGTSRLFALRAALYLWATSELPVPEEAPARDELLGRLADLHAQYSQRKETLERIIKQAEKADDYRLEEAREAFEFVAEATYRKQVTDLVAAVLEGGPESAGDVAKNVRAAAETKAALRYGIVPFTPGEKKPTDSRQWDERYHPEAAQQEVGFWQNLSRKVESKEELPLLDREKLEQRLEAIRSACRSYTRTYVEYWTETAPKEHLRLDAEIMARAKAFDLEEERINLALKDCALALRRAVNAADGETNLALCWEAVREEDKDYADRWQERMTKAVERATRAIENTTAPKFRLACQDLLNGWGSLLGELMKNPITARRQVMEQKPKEFRNAYIMPAADDYAYTYWKDLSVAGIGVCATEAEVSVPRAIERLASKYLRFPVSPPTRQQARSLTEGDIEDLLKEARDIVDFPEESIGNGERTGDPAVDQQLDRLVDAAPTEQRSKLKRATKVAKALLKTTRCEVRVLSDQPLETTRYWAGGIRLNGGGKQSLRRPPQETLGSVPLDGTIDLEIFQFPTAPRPGAKPSVSGPWAPVRLLHEGKEKDVRWSAEPRDEGKTWDLKLEFQRPNHDQWYALKLQVKFEPPGAPPFPAPEDFPSSGPGTGNPGD